MVLLSQIKHKSTLKSIETHRLSIADLKQFKTILDLRNYIKTLSAKRSAEKKTIKNLIDDMFTRHNIINKKMIKEQLKIKHIDYKLYDLNELIESVHFDMYLKYIKTIVKKYGIHKVTKRHIKTECHNNNVLYDKDKLEKCLNKIF